VLYPRDRLVLNQIGRVLFLQRQYKEAIQWLERACRSTLRICRHCNLMLCYQGLDKELAAREETLYRRFKADESAQAITGPYRKLHPDDNNERQQIHEHGNATPSQVKPAQKAYVAGRNGGTRLKTTAMVK
jgi:hypothetical protein